MRNSLVFTFPVILCMAFLCGCESRKTSGNAAPVKSSAAHFYELGYESSDPQEKLHLYDMGLQRVKNPHDTILPALLEGKVFALSRIGEFECSRPWIDSLIATAELQNDLFYLAKGYYRKAIFHRIYSRYDEDFENNFISRQIYLKMGDTAMAGRRSLDMANTQFSLGDLSGGQESATEALRFLDVEADKKYVSSAHNVLGLLYNDQRLYNEALKEYQLALEYAESRKDSLSYLHNIALVYKNQGNYDDALEIMKQLVVAEEPSEYSKARYRDNYAYTRWLKNPKARVDREMLAMVEERKKNNDLHGLLPGYSHLSDFYRESEPSKAKEYAKAYMETAKTIGNASSEADALKKLLSLSDSPEKEQYLERYLFLNDSLKDASLQTRYRFAKIRFDEERKQQQIALLESENVTMSLKAERFKTGTTISSLSALLVLITAGALLYMLRQRSKREKIKQIYLTESRISKRIHDEIANDIYNVMSTLEPAGHTPVVDKLEQIYLRTRDISRENREIDTGDNYLQALLGLLSSTTPMGTKLIVRGEESINWKKIKAEKKIVLYRVLQELMVNMKKHSSATLVALVFSTEKNQIKLNYTDNGCGTSKRILENGNGVKNLHQRLKPVNGNITFETEGKGLKAQITMSISS